MTSTSKEPGEANTSGRDHKIVRANWQVKRWVEVWAPYQVVLMCATAISMGLLLGAQYTFPVLSLPMAAELGWGRGATAAAFSVRLLMAAAAQVVLGSLVDSFGTRRMGAVGAGVIAVGLGLSSRIMALWQLYLLFGGLVAIGATFLELSILTALTQHFSARRGTAIGITWAGGGAGLFVLLPLAQALVSAGGWRATYWILGLAIACLVPLILSTFPPSSKRTLSPEVDARRSVTRRQALTTRAFWLLFLGNVFVGIFDEAVYQHLVPFAIHLDYPEMVAASTLGLASVLYLVGQVVGGTLSDRIGRESVVASASILTVISLLWLLSLSGPTVWGLRMAMILYGLGLGANLAARSATWSDVFGGRHFGSIVGIIWSGYAIGGAFISWFGGWVFDVSHSYALVFGVAIGATLLWCAALWVVAPRRFRQRFEFGGEHASLNPGKESDHDQRNTYPPLAIREMARLLKPGGRLVVTDMDQHPHTWLREEHHDIWLGY